MTRIAVIQGHPDAQVVHFGHALADAYAQAAAEAGHELRLIEVAKLDFPLLRSQKEWTEGATPEAIRQAQETLAWCEHMAIFFPLWLGDMPALLKGFFEQALRPGFAIAEAPPGKAWKKLLPGRSARIVVTMGMPAFFYRFYYRAHSVHSLERNVLKFCGIAPVRTTLIGMVEGGKKGGPERWLAEMHLLGQAGR